MNKITTRKGNNMNKITVSELKSIIKEVLGEITQEPILDLNKIVDVEVDGIDPQDAPDFSDAYISMAYYPAGDFHIDGSEDYRPLTHEELDWLNYSNRDFVQKHVNEMNETSVVSEMQVTDHELEKKIEEFGLLSDQIDLLGSKIQELKTKYSNIEEELRPLLEELKETKEKTLMTEHYLVVIKKAGYERTNTKYKEAFVLALTKVNEATKNILNAVLKETQTKSAIASTIGVQKLKEGNYNSLPSIDRLQLEIDKANSVLAQLAKSNR